MGGEKGFKTGVEAGVWSLRSFEESFGKGFRVLMNVCGCGCARACIGMRAAGLKKGKKKKRNIWALFMCHGAIESVFMTKEGE